MKLHYMTAVAIGMATTILNLTPAQAEEAIVTPGVIIGAKAIVATPYFERDILGADQSFGPQNSLKLFSFDWDAKGAYRAWAGYEWASGIGWSLGHMGVNQSTSFSRAEGTGNLQVHFDPDSDDADIFVNGTLLARNELRLRATDLEAWKKVRLPNMMLRFGAGLRYAALNRSFLATETGGNEFIYFKQRFKGVGPSVSYEVEVPVGSGFSLYNSGRGALLFGRHESRYQGEGASSDAGASANYAMLPTLDAELGLQWRGYVGALSGELTVRAGVEAQAWINGGGWDMFKDDMGAIFPQQAGSFGLQGFSISAQYKYAPDGAVSIAGFEPEFTSIVAPGMFVGAKAMVLTPYFENDIVGAEENFGAANSLKVLSFDWDAKGAYRAWAGYERASGFGWSLGHMRVNQSTRFSRAEGAGHIDVDFDPDTDDADINVDGTLNAWNTLRLSATDLEAWQKVRLPNMMLRFGAGLRFATLNRRFLATETGGNEFIYFKHRFKGAGPSLGYEVEVPVGSGFSLYNSGRGALLFGKHESRYQGENATGDTGASAGYSMVPTLDAELGLQWRGFVGSLAGELTVRAGVEAQAWINGGGWNMYNNDGGAEFPQQLGSFGLQGISISAQYKYAPDGPVNSDDYDIEQASIVAPGMFVGAKAMVLTPYFENDIVGADENFGGAGALKVFSFDWDAKGAYRAWAGYERASGFGWSLGHMRVNQSTRFSRAEGAGHLDVDFDPDTDDVNINVNGTLNAWNRLRLEATDLEAWQKVRIANMMLRYGAGLRYAALNRSFLATETGGNEFVYFKQRFRGFGPSLNYELEIPVSGGFSLYNSGRGALLFGKHESSYQGESATGDAGARDNYAMLPTLDAELGVQWRGHIDRLAGELTVRAGVEAQAWINGGGWNMYANDGGADFPQSLGNFALQGFGLSVQYKF